MLPVRFLLRGVTPLLAALLTVTLLGAPSATAAASARASADVSATRSPATTYAAQAFAATNAARRAGDRAALRKSSCLQRFATKQAAAMARQNRMFHQDLGPILRACGLSTVGENVAFGFASGRDVVRGWMGSDGHRANILNGRYRLMAIGAKQSGDGRWYVAQVFGAKR